ncbi:MAG TPA: biopolymer transporter Tol, partial [Cellulomonas sp.]
SANDWHVYAVPRHGGAARRVTADDGRMHFLHGVSPDGSTLAYVALEPVDGDRWARADLRLIAVDGSEDRALTSSDRPDDGPEFSPDGQWVYFGT